MSEYKRLTERTKHGIAVLDSGERFVLSCGGPATAKALNRLAELEDKIENGTLVELPRNKIKIRDDKDADWNSQNFPKGSGGPYDYDYKGEE